MSRTRLLPPAAAAGALLLLAGCGGGGGGAGASVAATTAKPAGAAAPSGSSAPAKTVKLEMYDYRFEPTALSGKPGQTVVVDLENEGKAAHTFTVASQNIDVVVAPGKDAKVRVRIPQNGDTQFVCRFHQARGMVGDLKVSGSSAGAATTGSGGTTSTGATYGY